MPNPATAIFRQIKFKRETTYGTIPAPLSGSQALRRVSMSPDLSKETYQSEEIRTDQQVADFRHGARSANATLSGEISPKAYSDFMAALVRREFAATTPIAGASITIAGTAGAWTITRAAGSYLSDGVKVGDVVALTAGSFNASNINKNLLVHTLTALVATCLVLNGTALVPEGPIASATVTVRGKKTFIPPTGHTDVSYSIESWFADIVQSEMYTGMKPASMALALPSTGLATIEIPFEGQNVTTNTAEQFTSPTAAPAFGIAAAVNGVLRVGGITMTTVRDLSINVNGNFGGAAVVGSNLIPNRFPGRVTVDGQFTAYFDSVTLRDAFINETEIALIAVLTSDNTALSDFIGITVPRLKVGSASKDDAQDGIVQTFSFTGLLKATGGAGTDSEASTIVIQDSQA
jgi:hypothetical protein